MVDEDRHADNFSHGISTFKTGRKDSSFSNALSIKTRVKIYSSDYVVKREKRIQRFLTLEEHFLGKLSRVSPRPIVI